jgi:orotidine-5'-phosphate decarboxylase
VRRRPEPRPRLLAITVLTSHDEASLGRLGLGGGLDGSVRRLALMARDAGMDGVVASPREARSIREACGPGFLIVTPGIRPAGTLPGDQSRHTTPAAALAEGADLLVMGRPVLDAPDPVAAVLAAIEEMAAVAR